MALNRFDGVDVKLPNGDFVLTIEHYHEKDEDDPTAFDTSLTDLDRNGIIIPIQVLDEVIEVLQEIRSRYTDQEMEFLRNA